MSNKKTCMLLVVLTVLLVTMSVSCAADSNITNDQVKNVPESVDDNNVVHEAVSVTSQDTIDKSNHINIEEDESKNYETKIENNISKKKNIEAKTAPELQEVSVSSNDTDIVSGIYEIFPCNVTVTCNDTDAMGDVELYVDDVLVETYSNQYWNNLKVPVPDIKLVDKWPVIPEYVNSAGNYTWRLEFKDNQGYHASSSITGTLEMMDRVDVFIIEEPFVGYPLETVEIHYILKPSTAIGCLIVRYGFPEYSGVEGSKDLYPSNNTYIMDLDGYAPSVYPIYMYYETYSVSDSYYNEMGVSLNYRFNTYHFGEISNLVHVTVLKVPLTLESFDTSFNQDNDVYVTMNLSSRAQIIDEMYEGTLNIYDEDTLIKTLDIYEFYNEDLGQNNLINFTLDKSYNNKSLRFEYHDPNLYYDDFVFERLIDVEKKNLSLATTSNRLVADVGSLVEIPYLFNDTVNDGCISISYGGSEDNITDVLSSNGVIGFDTSDYIQGEYDLILKYSDSSVYNDVTIPVTLELYQPTTITADKDELDIVLGKGNTYTVNFETSLDSWEDIIWGSIDVYVDDNIIDTIIVDDDTGNTGSITLDDYLLEDFTPGCYTLKAVFTTDDAFIRTSQTTVELNVGGEVILELPENPVAMIKESFLMPVNITFNGKVINTGNITWYFNNEDVRHANLTRNNFREFDRYINDNIGLYNITIEYHDYDNIYPSATNSTILMVRSNTTIKPLNAASYVKNTTLHLRLMDDKNNNFNGMVNITLPNGTVIEDIQCSPALVFIKDLPVGENELIISYGGSEFYEATTLTYKVNTVKSNTRNRINLMNDTAGNVTLELWIYDYFDLDTYATGEVEIINKATGEVVGRINNIESKATNVTLDIDKKGEYTLSIEYKGSNYHNAFNITETITVVGRTSQTQATINNETFGNTSVTVTVKDPETNHIITNAPITITLPNGTSINSNTGSTGTITIPIDVPVGENSIRVEFVGDDTYNSSLENVNTTILERESQTTAIITNSSIGNVTVEVTVTDKLTGTLVTIGDVEISDKHGNIIGTGRLNSDGTASITTTIDDKDISEIIVKYLGNTNYSTSNYTIDDLIVVGRLSDIIIVDDNLTIGNTTINITVKDPVTNNTIPDAQVIVTCPDGLTEELTTDEYGNLTIPADLPVGENTITIEFTGNDEYNSTTKTYTFTVTMRESETTATINNNTVRNTTIQVTVTDKTTGTPVTIGNIEIINTNTREVVGRATLNGTNTVNITTNIDTIGSYNLRVDFKGNTNYTSSSYTLETFNVEKRASEITTEIESDVYENTSIIVTVKDPVTGTPISNAPVTITLPDGSTINKLTDENGTLNTELNLPVGTSNITITYSGNDEYNTTTLNVLVTVEKRESTTTATITNSTARNTTINVTVTDKINGNPITSGTITVKDPNSGEILGRATLEGSNHALINANIDKIGNYDITVTYEGNNNYNSSIYTLNDINITGRQVSIETDITSNTTGNTTINITVKDPVTDTPLANTTINITYPDGTTENVTTDENGTVTIKPELPVGENNITITYTGNDEYNKTNITITAGIEQRVSQTTATIRNNTIQNSTITVTVKDKTTSTPVTSGDIEIINKETKALIATGTLTGTNIITIPVNLQAGTYNITVNYLGNINHTGSSTTLENVIIEKRESTITITTVNNTIDDTRINITVKDTITNNTIPNAPVTITLPDGETINTHTGTTGTATITLPLQAEEQTITVQYAGNNQYNTSIQTYTINVKKLESKITVTKQTAYIGDTITLTATITDKEENNINGGKVAFKLNDVTLKYANGEVIYATVENGIASITYTVPADYQAKTYKLSAVYSGNNIYNGNRSNTPLLNLKQRQAKLTLTTNGQVEANSDITFHVTVTDKQDNNREVNGAVIFKINGITLKDANDETIQVQLTGNTATYTYTLGSEYSARQHTITAVLINNTYVRSQAENNFNITKTETQINLNTPTNKNNQITITGTITDKQGQTITGTNKLAVKVDGKTVKTTNGETIYYMANNGNINITLQDQYTTDEHTIEVVTGERNMYTGARTNTTLNNENNKITKTSANTVKTSTVTNKQQVNIIPDKQIATTDETNTISIKIVDTNNQNIKKGKITFTSNGKTLSTSTITNGRAVLNHKYTTPGTYNITATYTDTTGTYMTTTKQYTIQIITQPTTKTTITANNNTTTVGETITYTTLYTDQHNNKIQTGTAKITIQNKTTNQKITNGITITPITLQKAGTYNITITLNNTTITRTITVNKQTPKLKLTKTTTTAGQTNTYTAQITTRDNVPLNEGKIQWKLNGITLKNNNGQLLQTTIQDGTSTLNYTIPTTWAGKTKNITLTYTGSTNYQITATTQNITIPQLEAKATITITPTTPKTQDNTTITITIQDKNTGQKIQTNDKIAIKINGKTITTTKLNNSSTTLKYKLPLLKTNNTQTITVVFGNNNYKRLDANKTFKIQKINTTTTLQDQIIKKGETLHIKTYIKDTRGEIMKRNDTYCIKLNGKTIHTGRLKNGLIDYTLPVNYQKGKTYNLTIKTGDNYYYNGQTKTVKLTVL